MAPFQCVVAYVTHGVSSFGLGLVNRLFADRPAAGPPAFTCTFCSDEERGLRTDLGLLMEGQHGLAAMTAADLIIVLPTDEPLVPLKPPVIDALRQAHRRGTIIAAYGSGSFLLAGTGLLDGRRAATDRDLAEKMARRYPRVKVDPGVLYSDEGDIVTGADGLAGVDMFLHLLRREHGTAVFTTAAHDVLALPRRENGQVRYVAPSSDTGSAGRAAVDRDRVTDLLEWARTRLQHPLSVDDLARQALMSPRTFARRFREATGTTPQAWLRDQRLDRAEELLETTDLSVEKIAHLVGFGSGGVLRLHFAKRHGVGPHAYRRACHARS
ncbi:GlxA family transcriptional regulator [Nonomuraea sp. CA-218870]|uniref:GlxA family transcriptional regulator n=1 Tax=Nonomuraea sp. CA-218870 TaxID=3239998 RepID=UPI003D8A3519